MMLKDNGAYLKTFLRRQQMKQYQRKSPFQ